MTVIIKVVYLALKDLKLGLIRLSRDYLFKRRVIININVYRIAELETFFLGIASVLHQRLDTFVITCLIENKTGVILNSHDICIAVSEIIIVVVHVISKAFICCICK